MEFLVFGLAMLKTPLPLHTGFLTKKTKENILTWDVTFLQKSNSEYTQVEKPVVVTASYEGSNKEEEFEIVHIVNNINSLNIVSSSNSVSNEEDFDNIKDNFFDEDVNDQLKISPQTTVIARFVQAMKSSKHCITMMPTKS